VLKRVELKALILQAFSRRRRKLAREAPKAKGLHEATIFYADILII
jgi:hypothetical protein